MQAVRLASAVGMSALLLLVSASPSRGQIVCQGRPNVSVYEIPDATNATGSVTSHVSVSEDAYVFVVETDLDGQIHVLHPDSAEVPARISARKSVTLPSFFAGFGQPTGGPQQWRNLGSRGTVIALASCAPFNLARVSSDGDWNTTIIRGLIERRSPDGAMDALSRYLGARGEPIGRARMWFASRSGYTYARIGRPFAW